MRGDCPRCGSRRPTLGPCPECGYEEPHPGVLGSYRRALARLREDPRLLVPFLLPTLLLVGLRALLYVGGGVGDRGGLVEGLAGVVVFALGLGWYLAAVGSVVPGRERGGPSVPEGPVYVASAVGAGAVAAPIAGFVLLVELQGPANVGAIGLVASVLLLLSSLVAAGRATGLPVEAALSQRWSRETLQRANRRGRENGGLGLVFLAFLMLVPLVVLPPLARLALAPPWADLAALVVGLVGLTVVGALVGVAVAVALSGGAAVVESFACPRCGAEARAEGGRAECGECGLEGPYYAGEQVG